MDVGRPDIGFRAPRDAIQARRSVFTDIERLRQIARACGPIQVIFAGKAHPHDEGGKEIIQHIFARGRRSPPATSAWYTSQDYDMDLARLLTAGVGRLAQHAAAAVRSLGNQRHESRG